LNFSGLITNRRIPATKIEPVLTISPMKIIQKSTWIVLKIKLVAFMGFDV
jgi:hypothetical protein